MELHSFERLANELGLVPMMITQAFAPYGEGARAGFPPDEALRLFQRQAAVPVDEKGRPIEVVLASAPEADHGPVAPTAVEIPRNWEALHHLQRIRIAKELRGGDEALSASQADEIIRAELQRRKER